MSKTLKIAAIVFGLLAIVVLAFAVRAESNKDLTTYYLSHQPLPTGETSEYKWSPARELAIYLYKADAEAVHDFSNLSDPVYLMAEYITPEMMSKYIKGCKVTQIDSFTTSGDGIGQYSPNGTVTVVYSNETQTMTAVFYKTVSTFAVFGTSADPLDLFTQSFLCQPKNK